MEDEIQIKVDVSKKTPIEMKMIWGEATHEGVEMEISTGVGSTNLHFRIGENNYVVDVANIASSLFELQIKE